VLSIHNPFRKARRLSISMGLWSPFRQNVLET
jgi:hypothetical protein